MPPLMNCRNRVRLLAGGVHEYEKRIHSCYKRMDEFATRYSNGIIWGGAILYKFMLDIIYVWCASSHYAYAGLVYQPNAMKYMVGSVMYFILFACLPKRENNAVGALMHLQFVYMVAPMLTFYAMAGGSNKYILMVFLCILLEIAVIRGRPSQEGSTVHIVGIKNYVTVMLGVLAMCCIAIPILYNGFAGLKAFDFSYIYVMRANATYPPGFGYLFNWFFKAIVPFAFVYAIENKRYRFAAACAVLQVLFYMECGNKFALFILMPVLAVYVLTKTGHLLKLLYVGFVVLLVGVLVLYRLDRAGGHVFGVYAGFWVAVRALFVPADIKFDFYGCFSQLPKVYFSDGQIGKMLGLTYPYKAPMGFIVNVFQGFPLMSSQSNTGYLGDSYGQMGFLGMLLMSALLGAILRGLSAYDNKKSYSVIVSIFCVFVILLNDIPLLTTLLTGGMLVVFFLIFIYYGDSKEIKNGV